MAVQSRWRNLNLHASNPFVRVYDNADERGLRMVDAIGYYADLRRVRNIASMMAIWMVKLVGVSWHKFT